MYPGDVASPSPTQHPTPNSHSTLLRIDWALWSYRLVSSVIHMEF